MNILRTGHALQHGFTLAELAISAALGLGLIGSMLSGYLALSTSAMDSLAASKLNLDIAALMSLMANELRRAGHAGDTAPTVSSPFMMLAVVDSMQANRRQPSTGSGSCLLYAWDADGDGMLSAGELAGFRLTADGAVQMRTSGNPVDPDSCSSQGSSWIALTDPELVTVTALDFDLSRSTCVNASEPDGVDDDADGTTDAAPEADCHARMPAVGSGDISVEQADIAIALAAQLAGESFVKVSQSLRVQPRNAVMRQH